MFRKDELNEETKNRLDTLPVVLEMESKSLAGQVLGVHPIELPMRRILQY